MDKAGNSEVADLLNEAFLLQRNKGLTKPGEMSTLPYANGVGSFVSSLA
jgi:hypothetical protein